MARTIAKDHDAKRHHILKTAARVFADEGIARASMSAIAQACGISKANIYHYYASKDDLLFDILDSYLSALLAKVRDVPTNRLAPADALEALLTEFLLAYEGMDHEHKIQAEGLPLLPEAQQAVLRGYQREMVDMMGEAVAALNPTAFHDQRDMLRDTTMSVFGMLNWFYMWNRHADAARRTAYARHLARFTEAGVRGI